MAKELGTFLLHSDGEMNRVVMALIIFAEGMLYHRELEKTHRC